MSYKPVSLLTPEQLAIHREKRRVYQRHYHQVNKEKTNAIAKRGYYQHRDQRLVSRKNRHEAQPWHQMVTTAHMRATKENIPFDIDADYVKSIFPNDWKCPVFGFDLTISTKGQTRDSSPSLDKIIPANGYVKNNCVVISLKANRMKNNGTLQELEQLVTYLRLKTLVT